MERKKGTPFWWKVKTAVFIMIVSVGTLYFSVWLGWPVEAWECFFLAMALFPVGIDYLLRRHCQKGERLFKRKRYREAAVEFEKDYEFLLRFPMVDDFRNWIMLFYSRDSLLARAVYNKAVSAAFMGDAKKTTELAEQLKSQWPESEVAQTDFSLWEPDRYAEFIRENEEWITQRLSVMLEPGESLDLRFYGIVTRKGRETGRCNKQPCLIGMIGNVLLLVALKKPQLEEVMWGDRISLEGMTAREVKSHYPNSNAAAMKFPNGEEIRIEFSGELTAGQYAGQKANTDEFMSLIYNKQTAKRHSPK